MQDDEQGGGVERGVALALEVEQHDHQDHDHEQVVPAFLEGVPEARQLGALQALQLVARGVGIDLHEQADVVQDRGQRRCERDVGVARRS